MADVPPINTPPTLPVNVSVVASATNAPVVTADDATAPSATPANATTTYTALATVSTSNIRGVGVNESA